MHDLYLESTLDRLLRTEEGLVKTHALKVLWVLRDHDKAVDSAQLAAAHLDKVREIADQYELAGASGTTSKLAGRLRQSLVEKGIPAQLQTAVQWASDSGLLLDKLESGTQEEQEEQAEVLRKARVELDGLENKVTAYQTEIKEMRTSIMQLQIKLQTSARERSDMEQQLEDCKRALAEAARSAVPAPVDPALAAAPARRVKLGASAPSGGARSPVCPVDKNTRWVERVVARWAHREVGAALDAWKASVSNHKRVAMLGTRIVGHWTHLSLSRAYETWHDHAHELALSRDLLRRTAARMSMREVSLAFVSWKDNAVRQRRARLVCGRIVQHWRHRCAAGAFESWHLHAKQMRRAAGIVQRVLKHWTHQTSAAAFESWHVHALEQKRMEQVCRHIVQKMLNHSLDVAMMTWKDHALKQRRATAVCARVVSHWLHRASARAFECWHVHAQEQRRMEDLCRKIVRWRVCKVMALVAFCSSSAARLHACLPAISAAIQCVCGY